MDGGLSEVRKEPVPPTIATTNSRRLGLPSQPKRAMTDTRDRNTSMGAKPVTDVEPAVLPETVSDRVAVATPNDGNARVADLNTRGEIQLKDCCTRAFEANGRPGLERHKRFAHAVAFHDDHVPKQRRKARWDHEDEVLLARLEATLRDSGMAIGRKRKGFAKDDIVHRLFELFDGRRTHESFTRVPKGHGHCIEATL